MAEFHPESFLKTNAALRTGRHLKLLPHVVDEHYYDALRAERMQALNYKLCKLLLHRQILPPQLVLAPPGLSCFFGDLLSLGWRELLGSCLTALRYWMSCQ